MDRIVASMTKWSGRRGKTTPVRRSEGRNAGKHIYDDAASLSSSSTKDLSFSTCSSFVTSSLGFPDRTSFRDMSLDESGPGDLAIYVNAIESCLNGDAYSSNMSSESSEIGSFRNLADKVVVDGGGGGGVEENKRGLERTPTITVMSRDYLVPNPSDVVDVGGGDGGGIKRLRPPLHPAKRPSTDHQFRLRQTISSSGSYGQPKTSIIKDHLPGWQKGLLLGRGTFACVYEGISGDGDLFAVKQVSLLEQGSHAQECIQQLEGEIALLSKLQHQNIVRYRGTAKDESNLYIFLELVSQGSLLKLYHRYQLGDSVVSRYTRQILDGLKYLHGEGFIHRDIKCANMLVDASGAVKLADFGLAKVAILNDIKESRGTPFWMAPEVINPMRTDGYGISADIWSLGCTVLEMLTGDTPYCNLQNPAQALFRIGWGVLPDIPDTLSLDARNFIIQCLQVNPEERPTAAELLNHPFVRRPLSSSGSGSSSGLGSGSS